MRIRIVAPGSAETLSGNWRTAERWALLLGAAGHTAEVLGDDAALRAEVEATTHVDVLVALHARRCHRVIAESHRRHPERPVVVALTGTDVYHDLGHDTDGEVRRSLELATRIVALQAQAVSELPASCQPRTRVIYQSAVPFHGEPSRDPEHFRVVVVANLRSEKDALRPALAARELPEDSRVQVVLVGAALDPDSERIVQDELRDNPRFRWLGYQSPGATRALMAGSDLVVIPSRLEGSSNVLSEAVVDGVPVLCTGIPGLVGTLGDDYPGYFPVEDTGQLRALLSRAESDAGFRGQLSEAAGRVRGRLTQAAESAAWSALLAELDGADC